MNTRASVSACFPAYNDGTVIGRLITDAFAVLSEHTADYEVVVVNDGSRDNTGEVLAELEARFSPRLRVITHTANRGYGGALCSGFAAATKELVFYTDGDGQYDIKELPALLEKMEPGIGLVNGFKSRRCDPVHRVLLGRIYNSLSRHLFGIRLRDINCDFRLIRRSLLRDLALESTSGAICIELVKKVEMSGCRIAEVEVNHYAREQGGSQFFRFRSLATTLSQILQLYYRLVVLQCFRKASSDATVKN